MEGGGRVSWVKYGPVVSLFVVFLAFWFRSSERTVLDDRLDAVLSSLLRAEQKVGINNVARPKVAIGFGGCADLLVDGVSLLNKIGLIPSEQPLHHDYLESTEQLAQSFAYFFAPGAAAERFMINDTLFSELVEASRDLPGNRWSVGGNAPVMAGRLAKEGCDVLLGGSFSPDFTDVLSEHITVAGKILEEPDIHLILEYPVGAAWGPYISRRANRYIIHSDDHNPYLDSMEEFAKKLAHFKPDLLVVGGLQMMDSFPFQTGERDSLLSRLSDLISSSSAKLGTHFEMASFVEESIMEDLLHYVIPYADSLGMNEQELPNLLSLLKGSNITVLSDPNPRVATVLDQMREVYRILNQRYKLAVRNEGNQTKMKPLTRLHVHTLAFQAMIVTRGSQWKNTMSATAKASLTANRHVCGSNDIDLSKARLIMDDSFSVSRQEGSQRIPLQESRPVSCWKEQDYEICVAPVLVCTEVYQTAGGGDNISAAGLVLQI
ncbi:ADP-dependent glucokinase-like [Periophthalmus magnuspinnatus]|uniref:ADP-dependent glucokinase-like n=1 Tax=Periophthalmus magnuspinnatus TaxID=409849 RepID=UPI00145B5035|nr:ADP-dependent glucokinase-like [Periophthalmus magnuspinnatus]XP_033843270.1 ADP-dependent glucokinase-like [Periophthalmus magnuspinnatus]